MSQKMSRYYGIRPIEEFAADAKRLLRKAVDALNDSCLLTRGKSLDLYQGARWYAKWAEVDTEPYEREVSEKVGIQGVPAMGL